MTGPLWCKYAVGIIFTESMTAFLIGRLINIKMAQKAQKAQNVYKQKIKALFICEAFHSEPKKRKRKGKGEG